MHEIVLTFLLRGFCSTKEDHLPHWVNQYRWAITEFRRGGLPLYRHPQPRLTTLINTGRGNCVAFSRLGASIAWMHGLYTEAYTLEDSKMGLHRVLVVHDRGTRWLIDNWEVKMIDVPFRDLWDGAYRIKRRWHLKHFDNDSPD